MNEMTKRFIENRIREVETRRKGLVDVAADSRRRVEESDHDIALCDLLLVDLRALVGATP